MNPALCGRRRPVRWLLNSDFSIQSRERNWHPYRLFLRLTRILTSVLERPRCTLRSTTIEGKGSKTLSTVLIMHDRLATTVMLFMFAVGFWGLLSFMRGEVLSGSISGALAIGQVLVIVQSLLGAVLYANDFRATTSVHYLYGITAVLITPFVWSYMKERHPRQALFFYSLTALFIAGLSIRGMSTGQ